MQKVNIKEIEKNYDIVIQKINKENVGQILQSYVSNLSKKIDTTDEISFEVSKYLTDRFSFNKVKNILYDEIKNERRLCINNKERYVIKQVEESNYNIKTVKAYSLEIILLKIDINVEDIYFSLYNDDVNNDIYSLDKYMYKETGWKLGHVDENIAYNISDTGEKVEKIRRQESVNSNWYDFLTKEIKQQFNCTIEFDTYNKLVNLYDIESYGDNIGLYLTHDNYIKSLSNVDTSQDIVTRLKLVGNDEMDIIGATATGYDYIEDYSYFMNNKEMSSSLICALNKYYEMVEIRTPVWQQLVEEKKVTNSKLLDIRKEKSFIYSELLAKNSILEQLKLSSKSKEPPIGIDEEIAKVMSEITKLKDDSVLVDAKEDDLIEELNILTDNISNINSLCKRESATDEVGELIFNQELLDELKEFIYYDTYTNDAFLNVDDLINSGKRELSLKSSPTREWTIDVVNFLNRIIDNKFRQHWQGSLALGDIIILFNKDTSEEELIYFVGYNQNLKNGNLDIVLSNKKTLIDNTKIIADYLNKAERALKSISLKQYLLIRQKNNNINAGGGIWL